VPTFYSLRDSRTPVLVSVATVLLNVVLTSRWCGSWGSRPGARTAASAIFNAAALLWLLRSRLGGIDERASRRRVPGLAPRRS